MEQVRGNPPHEAVQWQVTLKPQADRQWMWTAAAAGYQPLNGLARDRETARQAASDACLAATNEASDFYTVTITPIT